ncbi:hypothetical protein [Tuwongella immobilis]|uniref:Uncharacterized protein n=1 Tax=Tuwongella immobilis TaxID=692036 RepID=A0A6C2YHP0_9BACT|nr:hypothetical protein [Tuwongella immobilis]VIP00779.1 Uncharacterized protein OS=Nostoc sp. PCC 7107 GN=Nos7107_2708 PE=4 SV=1 [Tuwongella immobilis]VTR96976.1 Uncharacterized protein OS=Nostoc sp. PCC 7107 GN=Nos7107_2708 PE=4 SV=1 [Tuwongella immobilis]
MQQTLSSRDDFEYWLSNMDDVLESFLAGQPEEIRRRLDFSGPSLDVVESIILRIYPDTDSMLEASQSQSVNALSCYVGETFRKTLGGKWDIRLDDPKFAFAGLPILVGGLNQAAPRCPLTLTTATADRRTGNYLRTILENAARK